LRSSDGVLGRFTRDLTADAREGRLEPVRCRDDEIARVIDILLRHGKNNPALVGPAGVGKTAIAEGLAQRLAVGEVPLSLRNSRVLAVDHVGLLAGTTYRGQYEERIQSLVEQTSANPDVVLFIDELHNLIGQGTALGVAMDAANMLKPALVRGDFRVIGATTSEEYDRWIRGDPALERRFQRVIVRELSADETYDILVARKERLERHHNVLITDEAIRAAIALTDKFMLDRTRPDRAIDALDEACAHTHAVASYSERAETLITRRRRLLKGPARSEREQEQREPAREREREPENGIDPNDPDDDSFDRMARDAFQGLRSFGAELEAILAGPNETPSTVRVRAEPGPAPTAQPRNAPRSAESLADIEAALGRLLMEDGIIVRGHDIARVVTVSTGQTATWEG
jgi:ATP-dependent Clp protease ATP-binding subunit ClpC